MINKSIRRVVVPTAMTEKKKPNKYSNSFCIYRT